MKLHKYSITGLFFFIFLFACHRDSDKTSLLHRADSLMQEFPDSALAILESIPHVEKLSGSNRADYAIFLTRARTKMYIHESSDSLIRYAVDYYKRSWNDERKMQAYYYRGCVYRDMRCMDLAVKDFLQALKVIPKESEHLYLGAIYENLAGCYEEQNLYEDAMRAHHKAHEIYIKQKKDDGLFYAVRGIGYVFMLQHQLDSALVYYQEALDIAENIGKIIINLLYWVNWVFYIAKKENLRRQINIYLLLYLLHLQVLVYSQNISGKEGFCETCIK